MAAVLTGFSGQRDAADFTDVPFTTGTQVTIDRGDLVVKTSDSALASRLRTLLKPDASGSLRLEHNDTTTLLKAGRRSKLIEASEGKPAMLRVQPQVNKFLNIENVTLVGTNASYIAIIAVGMTMVIAMGGIDLSVGMIWAFSALIGAIFLKHPWNEPFPPVTILAKPWLFQLALVTGIAGVVSGVVGRRMSGKSQSSTTLAPASSVSLVVGGVLLLVSVAAVVVAMRDVAYGDLTREPMKLSFWVAIPLGVCVCCGVGALCGLVNGSLVVGLAVHPFIITLGMMAVLEGILFVLSGSQTLTGVPDSYGSGFFKAPLAGVTPVPIFVMLAVTLCGMVVLTRSVLGRRTLAIGDNERAATYAGIPVGRVKVCVYTLTGVLTGLSGAVNLGYWQSASPTAGKGYELQVIAAAVIGGASLSGGRGSALGAVLGAILIELIGNGMVMLEIDQSYNKIVMGTAIVAAVVIDQSKNRLQRRKT